MATYVPPAIDSVTIHGLNLSNVAAIHSIVYRELRNTAHSDTPSFIIIFQRLHVLIKPIIIRCLFYTET